MPAGSVRNCLRNLYHFLGRSGNNGYSPHDVDQHDRLYNSRATLYNVPCPDLNIHERGDEYVVRHFAVQHGGCLQDVWEQQVAGMIMARATAQRTSGPPTTVALCRLQSSTSANSTGGNSGTSIHRASATYMAGTSRTGCGSTGALCSVSLASASSSVVIAPLAARSESLPGASGSLRLASNLA